MGKDAPEYPEVTLKEDATTSATTLKEGESDVPTEPETTEEIELLRFYMIISPEDRARSRPGESFVRFQTWMRPEYLRDKVKRDTLLSNLEDSIKSIRKKYKNK